MRTSNIAALALSLTGCAAVFKGSTQEVHFASVPGEADVRVDAQYVGATPTKAEINRNSSQNIVISKDGYTTQYVKVKRSPDAPWWVWDIATCAIPIMLCIPVLVDAITGAWFSLDDDVRVKLDADKAIPKPSPAVPAPPSPTPTPNRADEFGQ